MVDEGTFGVVSPHPPIFVEEVGGLRAHDARLSLDALHSVGLAVDRYDPSVIVLMSPHAPARADALVVDRSAEYRGNLAEFGGTNDYLWTGDTNLADAIVERSIGAGLPVVARDADPRLRAGWLDHASIVPLSFIDPNARFRLVVLSLSGLTYRTHRDFGSVIAQVAVEAGLRVVFVASGDLSHRLTPGAFAGYHPAGVLLDAKIVELVERGRFEQLMEVDPELIELGGECGLRSVITMGGFLGTDPVPSKVLSYEGPWGVGYLTALAGSAAVGTHDGPPANGFKGGMPGKDGSQIVALARRAIESSLGADSQQQVIELTDPDLPERAGAFVSLHREGLLRGCIGTILPVHDTLAREVEHNAVEAAMHDPRFPPLTAGELTDLDIKVDVLHAPQSCTIEELDPSRYGVIVSSGWRRGLLLPDLEGIEDIRTQIRIAMQKAGIEPGEPCSFERFQVDRYT